MRLRTVGFTHAIQAGPQHDLVRLGPTDVLRLPPDAADQLRRATPAACDLTGHACLEIYGGPVVPQRVALL